jgi:hypothetical protein
MNNKRQRILGKDIQYSELGIEKNGDKMKKTA